MTKEELNKERPDLFCEFCGKQCKSLNSLNQHSTRCKENPNRKDFNKLGKYSSENRKGQTKDTCEEMEHTMSEFAEAVLSRMNEEDLKRLIAYLNELHQVAMEEIELRKNRKE